MHQSNESLWATLFTLAFGIGVLAYLTLIDRQEWFHIRPASGVAVAMADAAQPER